MPVTPRTQKRNAVETELESSRPPKRRAPKSIACQRCHAHKVKCSGGQPCTRCRDADGAPACVYPIKDRQIKISSQYIETILKDNERLRATTETPHGNLADDPIVEPPENAAETAEAQESVRNPLLQDRPWFESLASLDMPIHVTEAADAAFATRFRQTLGSFTKHMPRMSYVPDENIIQLSNTTQSIWPSPARARFLVQAALSTICRYYHMVRKEVVLESLERAIQNDGIADRLTTSKLYALFALGEVYSTKIHNTQSPFPGLTYFAMCRKMVTVPAERPLLDTLEIVLLLVVYSYALNRRHSASTFASSAVKLGTILGMHMSIPDYQFRDRDAREHRTRLWWTAYTFDRICSSKLGQPPSIPDDDVLADLPSDTGISEARKGDFEDAEYVIYQTELAKLSTQTISTIYSRRKHQTSFSQRVQLALRRLTGWVEALPPHLRLEPGVDSPVSHNQLVHLHLRFNQAVIVATRPVLLHVLRHHKESRSLPTGRKRDLPDSVIALAGTCVQCSRHSYRLLSDAWLHGFFPIFDYFNTQYLFSAANSLAVSSLLGWSQSRSDGESFNSAAEMLEQLAQSGSFAGKEYIQHIDAIKQSMAQSYPFGSSAEPLPTPSVAPQVGVRNEVSSENSTMTMTAGMALAAPSLQEFLAAPDLNLPLFEPSTLDGTQMSDWPELWDDGWAV
ncbi:hypothetical protein BU24DRAFT_441097 [Aaosphaeria arxii CBS 175.79]|uniref:Zn(2)-C6 fungal-type domain-containing protein n=1 Tax=Aaosphaeria arxii CBS 175.79 TaxID=1450172 RepID=A0A6A5XSQ8_9PLEO|nr:uncharacterized protein BU24DRAFT_441097 [Aaosphaeria arxii CBS 175.79]KAF2015284.1 hypothetical protein BU24DRAFT_441097 [Aaosphaeria arxii CBS 175.79]